MGRPSKPMISREGAIQAALEILDEEGLDKLSLQAVARRMGVRAPSLYYHFENKSELMAGVARLILSRPPPSRINRQKDWKESMVDLCKWARKTMLKHPNAAPLLLEVYPEQVMLPTYEFWLRQYKVPAKQKMVIMEGLEKITFGAVLLGAMSRARGQEAFPPDIDKSRFPALAEAIKSNRKGEEGLFEEILRRYLSTF
ncbi:MAG: TetR/AcrR family transcriptional regulator [Parahaliea sp.]